MCKTLKTDTIAAIATGMTNAGISIVRMSGDEALEIIDKIYYSPKKQKIIRSSKSYSSLWLYFGW